MWEFWYKKRGCLAYLLSPLSGLFCLIVNVRRALYRFHVFSTQRFKIPVIVVGNITVGGTGKTPLVCALAHYFLAQGLKPVIVSRGYGGRYIGPYRVRISDKAADVGDEALLLAIKTVCPVIVARKRSIAVQKILDEQLGDVVICDDGLQHYALARDVTIAVIDGKRRLGNGCYLPAGPLRESAQRLRSFDFVVTNGFAQKDEYAMTYLAYQFMQLHSSRRVTADFFQHKKVLAIAGIGFPQRFFDTLQMLNVVCETKAFPDHYAFSARDVRSWQAEIIIMTEKDAVKLREYADDRCFVLPIAADISPAFFNAVFDKIIQWKKENV